ncbi:fasciclin domain-containing protein [Chitinophaga sp. YIM B06452]|uniref:fasciclin domain-containing protein n=1 Tax=Chitinophaga sp. YIM B06452 TaxID=3082158 RepID=UPI0031FE718D
MKHTIKMLMAALLIASFVSCKKDDYFIGGSLHNPQFNGTTYEYLKTNPLFDTLLLLIDKTGLKDEVNAANTTFFAPTDYAIQRYVKDIVQERKRLETGDENLVFEFSELNFAQLKDSLRAYIFGEKIERAGLNNVGKYYTSKDGEQRHITLWDDPTQDYSGSGLTNIPKYIYFTKVVGTLDPEDNRSIPEEQRDMRMRCQTSGILTTNGVLHVLTNGHTFTFATAPK